jgi:hypothetical protein
MEVRSWFTVYGLLFIGLFRGEGRGARSKRIVLLATLHLPLTLHSQLSTLVLDQFFPLCGLNNFSLLKGDSSHSKWQCNDFSARRAGFFFLRALISKICYAIVGKMTEARLQADS